MVYEEVDDKGKNVHMKLPSALVDKIDVRVSKKEYESRPDFIKIAIRWYLDYLDGKDAGNIRQFSVPNVQLETPRPAERNTRP
jgi:Arc/MetJ-type ribon-helix-helix transcriptional regulator